MTCPQCNKQILVFPFKDPLDIHFCEDEECGWYCTGEEYEKLYKEWKKLLTDTTKN
jgi:hypothetical protein